MTRPAAALVLALATPAPGLASTPAATDLEHLNADIGFRFEAPATPAEVVEAALECPLFFYGDVHDRPEATREFLRLVDLVRRSTSAPVRLGVEFVDRGDWDVLVRYLQGSMSEAEFLDRLMPTSLLLAPLPERAHIEVLRYARRHRLDVLPLESRPAGSRALVLRNSEIRWNLAVHAGQHPHEHLMVLYGVQHLFGDDRITDGLETPFAVVTAYGDSIRAEHRRRFGSDAAAGQLVRLRAGVYWQALGGPDLPSQELVWDFGAREPLLQAIEAAYTGDWSGLGPLVAALADPEVRWRRAAFHALRFTTGRALGYDADGEPEARTQSQKRWQDWWRRQPGSAPR